MSQRRTRQKMNGEEYDYTSLRSRRILLWRSGQGKAIKRGLAKKLRQEEKLALKKEEVCE